MDTSQILPYLHFSGTCEKAMKFYQSVLGGELEISRFADFAGPDMPVSAAREDKIMHSFLKNDTLSFMASDGPADRQLVLGDNISLSISGTDESQLTGFFNGLSAGGNVSLPLSKQIWGDSFGMFTDKFGIHWMINIATGSLEKQS